MSVPPELQLEQEQNEELVGRYVCRGYTVIEGPRGTVPFPGCIARTAILQKGHEQWVLTMEGSRSMGMFPRRMTEL